jgi:hypothetical protein
MAVIDKINRRGTSRKSVLVGPGELVGPNSNSAKLGFGSAAGFTGSVDLYEITDGSGTAAGDYTITIRPYSENGFTRSIAGVEAIAVVKQASGVPTPATPPTRLGVQRLPNSRSTATLGPYTVTTDDKLYVIVDRKDTSTIKYQLEIDKV